MHQKTDASINALHRDRDHGQERFTTGAIKDIPSKCQLIASLMLKENDNLID